MDDLELTARVFHEQAVQAYISSRMLIATTTLFPVGLYNAHLACECMLKSIIAQAGSQPIKEHDLLALNTKLKSIRDENKLSEKRYISVLNRLNPYQELGRYGALASPQNDPQRISDGPIRVRGLVSSQPSCDIEEIDFAFALLRSKSKHTNDIIDKVLIGEAVRGWNYPISIEDIVLANNNYFVPNKKYN